MDGFEGQAAGTAQQHFGFQRAAAVGKVVRVQAHGRAPGLVGAEVLLQADQGLGLEGIPLGVLGFRLGQLQKGQFKLFAVNQFRGPALGLGQGQAGGGPAAVGGNLHGLLIGHVEGYQALLALLLGLAPFLALMGWYNFARFGNCLETGYGLSASQMAAPTAGSSFFPALAALFFSPGKSLFLYNPILIAVPFCFFGFVRKHTVLFLALFLAVIANLVYYSMQPNWAGDPAWGARHQAALLPFLVLPLVVGLERLVLAEMVKHRSFRLEKALGRPPRSLRLFIGLLFLISIPIQISAIAYEPPPIPHPAADAGLPSANPLWDYHQSQLFLRPVHFARYLVTQTKPANYTIADYTLEFLSSFGQEPGSSSGYRLHFFPFQIEASLTQNLPAPAEGENLNTEILINLLKIAWLTGLAGMLLALVGLLHNYRRIC